MDQQTWVVPASGRDPIFRCLCRLCERVPPDPSGSATVQVVIRGGTRLARAASILFPAGHTATPLSSPCGCGLSVGGRNMVVAEDITSCHSIVCRLSTMKLGRDVCPCQKDFQEASAMPSLTLAVYILVKAE